MRNIKKYFMLIFIAAALFSIESCKKNLSNSSGSLYTPTTADVTATATLSELQQGRTFYLNNCGSCHGLYAPENFSPAQWSSVMGSMAPKTQLSSAQAQLVFKYVSKGK